MMSRHLDVSAEVADALSSGRPVIALESTIISHGFPYPDNIECAREAERVARECGAVPATIAVLSGRLTVGLDESQLEFLATAGPARIIKASRRDLGVLIARRLDGATTVAATMIVAALAGIDVFATGGIGGVHRGAHETFDISADLLELARTDVAVVCAGAKSILDLGLTLEVLETHGVPVIGYQTDEFPAFYAPTSGFRVGWRADSAEEIAGIARARRHVGLSGGIVVANPIPAAHAIDRSSLDSWTEIALAEAASEGISGKEVTPFLLGRLHELSEGVTEQANKELVYHNVRLAAALAQALTASV
ncbi:MAG: pseudouridine-5'-phosphate glycosidase [Coriobacteriia bacterium]|jgi:pseudouridine-5'-phosphate glycosidase|nr:pseudouridine-5'-phosphate glycosidase [Coriobacteriia bacterium]